jgi:hypothetical protein
MLRSSLAAMTRPLSNCRGRCRLCIAVLCAAAVWMAGVTAPTAVSVSPSVERRVPQSEFKPIETTGMTFSIQPTPSAPSIPPTPTPSPKPTTRPTRQPTTAGQVVVSSGLATWYNNGPGFYGAAGPALRKGNWRGRAVIVCHSGRCVKVRLTDWCACGPRHGVQTVIDLSPAAFRALAPLSRGIIKVEVSR